MSTSLPDIYRSIVSRPGLPGESADAIRMTSIEGRISDVEDVALQPNAAIVAGSRYGPLTTLNGWNGPLVSEAMGANILFASPFLCPQTAVFDEIGIEITGFAAGSTIRVGLYAVGADGLPTTRLYAWGTIDTSATGWRSLPIGSLDGIIPRDNYWIAGAPSATIAAKHILSTPGMTAMLGYLGTTGTDPRSSLYRTTPLTAGFTSLPTPFGAITTRAFVPAFQLRAS